MGRAACLALAALFAMGCRSRAGVPQAATADAGGSEGMTFGRVAPPVTPGDEDPLFVVLSKGHLLIGEDEVAPLPSTSDAARTGFDARFKRGDPKALLVVPLFDRAKLAADTRELAHRPLAAIVAADTTTPYRIITEVLYTLGQAHFPTFHMMVIKKPVGAGADAGAPHFLPSLGPLVVSPHQRRKPLELRVSIGHDGIRFSTADGPLGTACQADAPGVTVPKVGASQDMAGVQRCAFALKSAAMDDTGVTLTADEDIDWGTVIETTDALREADGQKLFPDLVFGPTN